MHNLITLTEHHECFSLLDYNHWLESLERKRHTVHFIHRPELPCYSLDSDGKHFVVDTHYFVGVDWIIPNETAVFVEPKLNGQSQVNFLGMLSKSLEETENLSHLHKLFDIDYNQPWIQIAHERDMLSPLLVTQFLELTRRIVQKGLRKSYYFVSENLNGKVRGKILLSRQVQQNILRNKPLKTVCTYQEYGVNNTENQFLKYVLQFVSAYVNKYLSVLGRTLQNQLLHNLSFCNAAFELIDTPNKTQLESTSTNSSFYSEYSDAMRIGRMILKRYSFSIDKVSEQTTKTPPFWIDMSKLFELYVFKKVKDLFPEPNEVIYHRRFKGGKETDILIRSNGYKCVLDCKYKPYYHTSSPSLKDKRQLAGYTRLRKVYDELNIPYDQIVPGVILYANQECRDTITKDDLFINPINEYIAFYKTGISLPTI